MYRDQYSSLTEEDTRIISWMKETRATHPHLLWIDDMENLDAFLERTYSYEVAQQAIDASHLNSILHVPAYYLLPRETSVLDSLKSHRIYYLYLLNRHGTSSTNKTATNDGRPPVSPD